MTVRINIEDLNAGELSENIIKLGYSRLEETRLEKQLSEKSKIYEFDEEYKLSEEALLRIKNPKGNYRTERMSALRTYLTARTHASVDPIWMSQVREWTLTRLKEIKHKYGVF